MKRLLLFFMLFQSIHLFAWNKAGHMISAFIACKILKDQDPAALHKVVDLLKYNPLYNELWASQIDSSHFDESLFMLASSWPDDVRKGKYRSRYSKPEWHYINMPYYSKNTNTNALPLHPINILTALDQNLKVLSNGSKPQKAIALCWIIHLFGDIHQPLHTISLINKDFPLPNGDKGGNKFYIKPSDSKKGKKLHVFWDDIILSSRKTNSIKKKALSLLLSRPEYRKIYLAKNCSFNELVQESYSIAIKDVYLNGTLKYCLKAKDAPLAPQSYKANSKSISEERVVAAGIRMAAFLQIKFQ